MRLIVIGGGAAGFFCAINAARMNSDLKVTIVEKTNKILTKVKVSGGGRCNVTHACTSIEEMIRKYPRGINFLKKSFHHFFVPDTLAWFEERGVKLKIEEDGRIFPVTNSSQTIIDCLMKSLNDLGVQLRMNKEVKELIHLNGKWNVRFLNEEWEEADYVCLACGGYPKSSMFDWIKRLGHTIEEPVPSLFTFNIPDSSIRSLMGIAIPDARVKIMGTRLEEQSSLLITHWGLSGPVILRLSAWGARELAARHYEFVIQVNWIPAYDEQQLSKRFNELRFELASQKVLTRNAFALPQRLWEYLLKDTGIEEQLRWADLPIKARNRLIKSLCAYEFLVKGKTTFKEEFVTAGGIRLSEIDPTTMESKLVRNLFFAGEIMDVDGITGGFNFQHSWTSGWIAAQTIANRKKPE